MVISLKTSLSARASSFWESKLFRVAKIRWAVIEPTPSMVWSSAMDVSKIRSTVWNLFSRRLKVTGPTPSARISFSHFSMFGECLFCASIENPPQIVHKETSIDYKPCLIIWVIGGIFKKKVEKWEKTFGLGILRSMF